ncbi:MAG TPA: DUF2252 domain-containing protein [Conexibacter sp.]|nr:DUF2252 domain-containing protein [Conexibacter sp.]
MCTLFRPIDGKLAQARLAGRWRGAGARGMLVRVSAGSPLTAVDRAAAGKRARVTAPRSRHGAWEPAADRPDPVALLEEQARTRVPELVPIRHGRMATSPFAFFRGAAAIMAADLAETRTAGIRVQLCGDAHLSNFGGFASPERELVFDLNDFDETLPGPWEWDLKRLAASVAVTARGRGWPRRERRGLVRQTVRGYREAIRELADRRTLDVWYARIDEHVLAGLIRTQDGEAAVARFQRGTAKARRKDSTRAFAKLAQHVDGQPRIAADPPLIVPLRDMLAPAQASEWEAGMAKLIAAYRATLPTDRRVLLDRFRFADMAHKVVGVGSVGTRAWILLMLGRDDEDPLFLQCKEAQASVLAPYAGASRFGNQGRRVVEGQRLMQAASDIFLGWVRTIGLDGRERDFYVRQLWDWKVSADVEAMDADRLATYGRLCGATLARAHARCGDAVAIGAYLGSSDACDRAFADFAEAYADQNERDHAALLAAIDAGRLEAQTGV